MEIQLLNTSSKRKVIQQAVATYGMRDRVAYPTISEWATASTFARQTTFENTAKVSAQAGN